MKVTINVPDDLLCKVDGRAKEMYLSRSAFITMALNEKLHADAYMDMMPELMAFMHQMKANNGPDTDDTPKNDG